MTANVLSRIFTIEIGDTPTLMFEAQNMREAQELGHEQWLKDDLAEAKSDGAPLWDGTAKLRARMALPDESALFAEAKNNGQPSDGMMLVYLVFENSPPLTRQKGPGILSGPVFGPDFRWSDFFCTLDHCRSDGDRAPLYRRPYVG